MLATDHWASQQSKAGGFTADANHRCIILGLEYRQEGHTSLINKLIYIILAMHFGLGDTLSRTHCIKDQPVLACLNTSITI